MNNTSLKIALGSLVVLSACSFGVDVDTYVTTTSPSLGDASDTDAASGGSIGSPADADSGSTSDGGDALDSTSTSTSTDDTAGSSTGAMDGGSTTGDPLECTAPEHVPCDAGTNDPFRALGLNCPGELQVNASTSGPAVSRGLRSEFGGTNVFDPREGTVYAVIGSGVVAELNTPTPNGDSNQLPTYCSDDLGPFDLGAWLPPPILLDDPTLAGRFAAGALVYDYVEMRFSVQVPPDVTSFSYDFAFFSTEYPYYYGADVGDMYIAWLEDDHWTGNISYDGSGNPISLNASFLEYTGSAPELAGTCIAQHASTGWLTTTAGVTPGENITVVFAIFDVNSDMVDSYAFIDNFEWSCEDVGEPLTVPR